MRDRPQHSTRLLAVTLSRAVAARDAREEAGEHRVAVVLPRRDGAVGGEAGWLIDVGAAERAQE